VELFVLDIVALLALRVMAVPDNFVILEGDIDYWVEGGRTDPKPWEIGSWSLPRYLNYGINSWNSII